MAADAGVRAVVGGDAVFQVKQGVLGKECGPGNYYEVTIAGTGPNLYNWTEWY